MTKHGFFSAVKSTLDGSIMVRARSSKHLQNVIRAHKDLLSEFEIMETDYTDYPVRIIIPHGVFTTLMERLSKEVEYSNFKEQAANLGDNNYLNFLHDVWELGLSKIQGFVFPNYHR